ncbi:GFA family protein [Sphingobium sp. YG1]|uniref:GFA family protein n=1 Tax=Sphingobium sp. YG1 TaxID=2082188 RepID=UPI000DBB691E|nr:GFA family protein [Sphingobium sp. YG1]BBD01505.1 hypothetical protein YGS_C1P2760 [Sphingobium sp. YG1]
MINDARPVRTGRCLCGEVRFDLMASHKLFVSCQCRDCRHVSGGAPAAILVVDRRDLRLTAGEEQLGSFGVRAESGRLVERQFCATCGTQMFEILEMDPEIRLVKAGTLSDQDGLEVDVTVWQQSEPSWWASLATSDVFERHFSDDYHGRNPSKDAG